MQWPLRLVLKCRSDYRRALTMKKLLQLADLIQRKRQLEWYRTIEWP